jgi:hypothetical protein
MITPRIAINFFFTFLLMFYFILSVFAFLRPSSLVLSTWLRGTVTGCLFVFGARVMIKLPIASPSLPPSHPCVPPPSSAHSEGPTPLSKP